MKDKRKSVEAVLITILDGNKVLLQQRQNTGWLDGWYDMPSGHVEVGESLPASAIRELNEETTLKAKEADLKLFHISRSDVGANPYTYFVFRAEKWQGVPAIGDPDKVKDVGFYDLDDLPQKTVTYVRKALECLDSQRVTFSYFGPGGHESV